MLKHDMLIGTRMSEQLVSEMLDLGMRTGNPTGSTCVRAAVQYWVDHKEAVIYQHETGKPMSPADFKRMLKDKA